ncbi:hypothetical protein POM88_044111 [Heracleum sosnowskyi]|uniref:Uncharacterized protein n=1 Tax=Heracleum sosnowskyi TaxID=360622 RepID=A0AAD8H4T1_9APIA|nr:hypothetical protein POM88_044111 [Heracleum sosnowskyi]
MEMESYEIDCKCGDGEMIRKRSNSEKNRDRMYYICPKAKSLKPGCDSLQSLFTLKSCISLLLEPECNYDLADNLSVEHVGRGVVKRKEGPHFVVIDQVSGAFKLLFNCLIKKLEDVNQEAKREKECAALRKAEYERKVTDAYGGEGQS